VSFGGAVGLITKDSATRIIVMSPAVSRAGAVVVTVTTSAGTSTATAADTYTYRAAPRPSLTAQAITFASQPSGDEKVGGTYDVTATGGGSGNPVTFAIDPSSTPGACASSGTDGATVTFNAKGTCVIDANQAGNAKYLPAAQEQQTVVVIGLAQAITFTSQPSDDEEVGDTYAVTATGGDSGNPVTFSIDSSSTPGACASSGTNGATVTFNAAGTCIIDANQAGDAQYLAAGQEQQTVEVGIRLT
jgi:predicted secreted protein